MFCSDIVTQVLHPGRSGGGAGQHNRATTTTSDDMRYGSVDGVEYTGQVDVDDVLPGLFREAHKRSRRRDACIRGDDIEAAEFGDTLRHGALESGTVADVSLDRDDPAVEFFDQNDSFLQVLFGAHRVVGTRDLIADVDRNDISASLGEPQSVAATLSARRSGDQRDLAFYSSHRSLLSVMWC